MLTGLKIRNFKRLHDVELELGQTVLFIGPNNSGKTTALQALALWEIGLRKCLEKRNGDKALLPPTINRRDLFAIPVPNAAMLWRNLDDLTHVNITASGVTGDDTWECGLTFQYANPESIYCWPIEAIPSPATSLRIAFLPPMSGLALTEEQLHPGAINVRIGEGRTAEVLRNLCEQLSTNQPEKWAHLRALVHGLFAVTLHDPEFLPDRGQIEMRYQEHGLELDLICAGRGLQQTLLLLAYLYTHPGCVLLLDEPDAHLEILRQREIYRLLNEVAAAEGCQLIAATHSEVLLDEAGNRDMVIAFVGKPHRIDTRGSQLRKALTTIGFDQYSLAEQRGWVLYLEGSTDLAILQQFAARLQHPSAALLEAPFVHYVANVPSKACGHFFGLREAKPDLVGIALYDRLHVALTESGRLRQIQWRQRELENYLCFPETLLAFAGDNAEAMQQSIVKVSEALRTLRQPDPFGPDSKASDDFLNPLFQEFYSHLGQRNLMQKTDYHTLAPFVPLDLIDAEISEKLDVIVEVAAQAKPVTD